ncbi:hypothetical protein KKI90_22565 [Xenorhabdus bovienii]|uniref:hypothetical protein n=1 Tax=Xenorhabdus bovienii TaxID=40576 RepID=UPI00237C8A51|nr:hypothetical protein [Xenorhabdus bovienii]MDE1488983.1 hypothetical protein [Xenorhabdus bovienii]MDE9479847.1 hypothetical protein [Xenorhabdus bovienii]MDE9532778.1 hypothetical protein [Xenorhabdus bovienii]
MEVAKVVKNTRMTRKAQALESFFHRKIFDFGNNELAREMGIHPSVLSRDKNRIAKLASKLIVELGLPEWALELSESDNKSVVVIEGEHAERLIQALECKGKIKRKTPVAVTTEASEMQLEMSI